MNRLLDHFFRCSSINEPLFFVDRSTNEPHFCSHNRPNSQAISAQGPILTNRSSRDLPPFGRLSGHIFTLSSLSSSCTTVRPNPKSSTNGPHFLTATPVSSHRYTRSPRLPSHIFSMNTLDSRASFLSIQSINRPHLLDGSATNHFEVIDYPASFLRLSSHKYLCNCSASRPIQKHKRKTICYIKKNKTGAVCCFSLTGTHQWQST